MIKKYINNILKIFILLIGFIGINTVVSKAAIYSTDPNATTNSTVSITITSDQALDNFNIDVTNSGGLTFSSVSTKGISNGTAIGYITLSEPLTTLATYNFKTPSSPGTYKVTFNVNGVPNTSTVKVSEPANSNSNSGTNGNTNNNDNNTNTKSNVAILSNLGIKPNDFSGFKANTFSYNVEVPNETESIEVYASKGQSGQTISGTGKKSLKEGVNTINVVVTAEDGKTKKTYTINVTRKTKEETEETEETEEPEENSEEEPMEEAFGLSELKVEGFELEPEFQTDIYEYRLELKEDLEKLNITTLATKENSNIEITGNDNLQEGENIITIMVKGENEAETVAYQIIVNKTLEKQEDTSGQEQQEKMKKIIILSVAGGVILIIVIAIIIVKIKKSKESNDSYIPYENLMDDYEDDNEVDEQTIEDVEEDEFYEEKPKKKKHSKGKRFK